MDAKSIRRTDQPKDHVVKNTFYNIFCSLYQSTTTTNNLEREEEEIKKQKTKNYTYHTEVPELGQTWAG